MKTEIKNAIKDAINLSARNIFYFTGVAVLTVEMFLVGGKATGTVLDMPAYYVMIVSGITYFVTEYMKSPDKPELKEVVL